MIKKSYSLYNVVSVREEFWVSPRFVSHAKNVIIIITIIKKLIVGHISTGIIGDI